MNTRTMFAGLLSIAMAVTFLFAPAQPSFAQTTVTTAQQTFNGPQAYKEVFDRLSRFHINLQDPQKRADWEKEWKDKYKGKLVTEDATNEAILEMVHSLEMIFDNYLLPDAVKAMNQQTDPSFAGIGIHVQVKGYLQELKRLDDLPKDPTEAELKEAGTIRNDERPFTVADEPMDDLPAQKAGLQRGDEILEVDGTTLDGLTSSEAVELIRGKIGTDVTLKIRRADDTAANGVKEFDVKITRAKVVPKVVKVKDLGDGVTHIRLYNFMSKNLESEMVDALKQGAKGKAIVFDLRGNGGGRLDAALNVLNYFVEEGVVLVKRERDGDGFEIETTSLLKNLGLVQRENTTNPAHDSIRAMGRATMVVPKDMPVVVLIDGGSASASEIVSGALQHQKRAKIMGTPSFGKGVGQAVMPLSFGRMVTVTTFEFMPGGNAMALIGIIPDKTVEQPEGDMWDPDKDTQLDAAKTEVLEMVKQTEAREAKVEELRKEKLDKWKKSIEAQKKQKP